MSASTQTIHPIRQLVVYAPKAVSVCGFVTACVDLLEPLGPIALYSLLGSLAVVIVTFPAFRLIPALGEEIAVTRATAVLVALLSGCLLFAQQSDPGIAETGWLAKNIPAAAEFQQQVLRIEKSLASIEKSSADTAQHTREIAGRTHQAVQELQGLKREVSTDPRKELANMGVRWEYESLSEAIRNQDGRVIELLLAGGMRPKNAIFAWFTSERFQEQIAELFTNYKTFDAVDACPLTVDFYRAAFRNPQKTIFVRKICSVDAVLSQMDAQIALLDKKLSDAKEANRNRTGIVAACVNDLKSRHTIEQLWTAASHFSILSVSNNDAPEDRVKAEMNKRLLLGQVGDKDLARAYHDLIGKACSEANPVRSTDAIELDHWREARRQLTG